MKNIWLETGPLDIERVREQGWKKIGDINLETDFIYNGNGKVWVVPQLQLFLAS